MKHFHTLGAVFVLSVFLMTGCSDTTDNNTIYSEQDVLTHLGNNIILPIYSDLAFKANELKTAIMTLRANPNAANFAAARSAWITAREPFELAEGFEWGPLKQYNLKPTIDYWPFARVEFDSVMATSFEFTPDKVATMPYGLRGYHAMEYVLWGDDHNRQFSDLTAWHYQYLEAIVIDFADRCQMLYQSWAPSGSYFVKNLLKAGTSESIYPTVRAAFLQVFDGMNHIIDELGEEYLAEPYNDNDPYKQESYYSNTSTQDFVNIVRGATMMYTGIYKDKSGPGISAIVKQKQPSLDDSVRTALANLESRVRAILPTYTDALRDNRSLIGVAIEAAEQAHRILEDRVFVILSE